MEDTNALKQPLTKENRSLIWFYAAGALIILSVAAFLILRPGIAPQSDSVSAPAVPGQANSHADENFSLAHPAGWTALSSEELNNEGDYFSYAIRHDSPGALVTVKVEEREPGNVGIDKLAVAIDEQLIAEFDEFQKLDSQILQTESGHKALKYDYVFTKGPGNRMRQQLYVVLAESKTYYIAAQAKSTNFEVVEADIDQILSTFAPK